MLKFEAHTYAEASTSHVTENDSEVLSREAGEDAAGQSKLPFAVGEYREGYYVSVPSLVDEFVGDKCKEAGLSKDFFNLLKASREQGFDSLRLDADAPKVDGLPAFDW